MNYISLILILLQILICVTFHLISLEEKCSREQMGCLNSVLGRSSEQMVNTDIAVITMSIFSCLIKEKFESLKYEIKKL